MVIGVYEVEGIEIFRYSNRNDIKIDPVLNKVCFYHVAVVLFHRSKFDKSRDHSVQRIYHD